MESARLHASQPARPLVLSVTRHVRTNNVILSEEKNKEDCCKRLSSFVCVASKDGIAVFVNAA